jgi:hypothetical protein
MSSSTEHTILYIPGLGDSDLSRRQWLLSLWRFRNVRIEICAMDWSVDEPWQTKLGKLTVRIDELVEAGNTVSLIGESAGACAVICALVQREAKLNRAILLCGKFQYPDRVAAWRYKLNPSFKAALTQSHALVPKLTATQKAKLINLHPIHDPVVPVAETKEPGFKNSLMPIVGHSVSIVFANTLWSWRIVRLIKSN